MGEKKIYTIFLASPSDLQSERDIVERVIFDINTVLRSQNIVLELIRWERDSFPSIGEDAQAVINRQIGKQYNIFIGIFGSRFGTPTSRGGSGTEEEFMEAYHRYNLYPGQIEVLLYFKDTNVRLSSIDIEQLVKIQNFQKLVTQMGVYYSEFKTKEEFYRKLHKHLVAALESLKNYSLTSNQSYFDPSRKLTKAEDNVYRIAQHDFKINPGTPQWADYLHITPIKKTIQTISFNYYSEEPYYRIGIKFLEPEGRLFGDGSIQSSDRNRVLHLGQNSSDEPIFITSYINGVRESIDNRIIENISKESYINVKIVISLENLITVFINDKNYYQSIILATIRKNAYLLVWGDGLPINVSVKHIEVMT